MTGSDSPFEAEVRRAAPDLWLSSRLVADPAPRAALLALYALNLELAKTAPAAGNPLAGEIRLAWWREEVEAMIAHTRPLGHPALQVLANAPGLDQALLQAMIEARHAELEPRPFKDEPALLAYLDGVEGGLMQLGARLLSPEAPPPLVQTARAWGWWRLLLQRSAWRAKGRDWTPLSWGEATDEEIAAHVRHLVLDALVAARRESAGVPVAAFPAIAHATLARPYAQGRTLTDLEKRARLLWASLRGRI